MRIKTDAEMMDTIIGFAEADDRIRAVLLNGSRVNPNVTKDPFQDYDIATFVRDVEPFRHEEHVLPHFGEVPVVEQPLIGPWPPADADDSYYNYNMQLTRGYTAPPRCGQSRWHGFTRFPMACRASVSASGRWNGIGPGRRMATTFL